MCIHIYIYIYTYEYMCVFIHYITVEAMKPYSVVVKIMVPFWVPNIVRHRLFRVPKRGHNFDNYPYVASACGPASSLLHRRSTWAPGLRADFQPTP